MDNDPGPDSSQCERDRKNQENHEEHEEHKGKKIGKKPVYFFANLYKNQNKVDGMPK